MKVKLKKANKVRLPKSQTSGTTPVSGNFRITEDSDYRILENGDFRVLEN